MAHNQLAQLVAARVQAYNAQHPQARLDPQAVLAVAAQEGLGGGIGDGGHAYGPFQLNNAGGVITGSHPGVNDPGTQAWASSAPGIDFALGRIGTVAGGLHGQAAVENIVSRFERPANIPHEIAGALHAYGLPVPAGGAATSAPTVQTGGGTLATAAAAQPAPAPQVDYQPQLASLLAGARTSGNFGQFYGTLAKALAARRTA